MDMRKLTSAIKEDVNSRLDMESVYDDGEMLEIIEDCVLRKAERTYMPHKVKRQAAESIFNSMRRLDILQPLLDEAAVSEIMVNGTDCVYVERNGRMTREDIRFENEKRLFNIIQSIVSKINRTVNEASPIVDARLKDGSRINVVMNPIALNGPILTIRKFPEQPFTMEKLTRTGFVDTETAALLQTLVESKYSIFICGGTSTGKTTLLNALSEYIPAHERIITIEDSAELQIAGRDNLVRLEARNANTEGKGRINIRDLIKASLRMRPDRIVIGEVRGEEAVDLLQVMNTGHEGSLCTGHANSGEDMLSRLETMVLCASSIPLGAIRRQIASAIDIIVHLERNERMERRVMTIDEICGCGNDGDIILNRIFTYEKNECERAAIKNAKKR